MSAWAFAGIAVAAFVVPILITNLTGDFHTTGGGEGRGRGGRNQDSIEPSTGLGAAEPNDGSPTRVTQEIRGSTSLDSRPAELASQYGFALSDVRAYLHDAAP